MSVIRQYRSVRSKIVLERLDMVRRVEVRFGMLYRCSSRWGLAINTSAGLTVAHDGPGHEEGVPGQGILLKHIGQS